MRKNSILIVDDEAPFAATLMKRLGHRGFNVSHAHDGKNALEMLRGKDIDVVLLDLKLPDMDGIQVLKGMRLMRSTSEVVLLSGHAIPGAMLSAMAMGAFDYLTKPFPVDTLAQILRGACQLRKARNWSREMAKDNQTQTA